MKVLVLHNFLWAHYKSVFFEEIQELMPLGYEFHVLQIAKNEISRKNMETDGMDYQYNYTLLFDDFIENVNPLREIWEVLKFILKFKPDILNLGGYSISRATIPTLILAKIMGTKVILSNESTSKDHRNKGFKVIVKRWIVKSCVAYVAFGKSSEDYLLELGASPYKPFVKKAAVVDNIILRKVFEETLESDFQSQIKTKKNFVFVGRLSPEKNIIMLVEVFQRLKNKEWGLIIIGDGSLKKDLMNLISQNPSNIFYVGSVGWKEVAKFFTKSDCLVLPSNSEPWGLVVNEAMVCGLPVIVSDNCGCVPDLVKENGIVVETNSESSLYEAMDYISKTEKLEAMSRKSLEIISEFSVENAAKDYVNLITKL